MLTKRLDEIPEFLKSSSLYQVYQNDLDTEEITIEDKHYVETSEVTSIEELYRLYEVIRYWGANIPYFNVFNYVFHEKRRIKKKYIFKLSELYPELNILNEQLDAIMTRTTKKLINKCIMCAWMELLDFLRKIDITFHYSVKSLGLYSGKVEVLQFIKELGHRLDKGYYIWSAVKEGLLECIKYLLENGEDWLSYYFELFCVYKHKDCIQYVIENGYRIDKKDVIKTLESDKRKYRHILNYLRETYPIFQENT